MSDITQKMVDQFYDRFQAAIDEAIFEFMTEGDVHITSERIVCALKNINVDHYWENSHDVYDEVWHDASELSMEVMERLKERYKTECM